MADGSPRQPPQAYDTVSPAGVGATTTNQQVSPGTVQEILDTHDENLIEQAFEQMDDDALTRYLESLPDLPQTSSPAGVGRQASHTPSTVSVRTPTPSPPSPRTQRRQLTRRTLAAALAAAGAGGDGDDDGCGGSGGSRRSTPRGRPGRGQGRARRGRRPGRPNPSNFIPWIRPDPSTLPSPRGSWSPGSQPRTLGQADFQRRLRMMMQDQEQLAQGREIANVTMTNSIVTSYKQGGTPSVQTSSSRISP